MEGRKLVGEMNKKFGASQENDGAFLKKEWTLSENVGAFRLEYSDVFIMMLRG